MTPGGYMKLTLAKILKLEYIDLKSGLVAQGEQENSCETSSEESYP